MYTHEKDWGWDVCMQILRICTTLTNLRLTRPQDHSIEVVKTDWLREGGRVLKTPKMFSLFEDIPWIDQSFFFRWVTTRPGCDHTSRRKWAPHHWKNPKRKVPQKWKAETWYLVSTSKSSFNDLPRKPERGITSTENCLQSPWMHCLLWRHCRPSLLLWTRSPSLPWLQKQS